MNRAGFPAIVLFFLYFPVFAGQPVISPQEYVSIWKDEAIYQMAAHKIPASITLAQGMLESGNGNSRLATKGNNHFGIKCHSDWKGERIYEDDDSKNECFRKYNDARESYEDHSLFLQKDRYQRLFDLGSTDYKAWAKGLKECGYATNPKYPDLLIRIINEHNLTQYDEVGNQHLKKGTMPERVGLPTTKGEKKKEKPAVQKPSNTGGGQDDVREINLGPTRETFFSSNDVKFVEAKEGELPADIAEEFDMGTWQILNYNNIESSQKLKDKQVIYLQPKRAKGTQDTYTVKAGDNTWSISQQFAIRMKKLRKLNGLVEGAEPSAGTTLKLR